MTQASGLRTILCYGDSNTFGTAPMRALLDDVRLPPEARWPNVMGTALGDGYQVIAEGLPGRTTVHDDPIEGAHMNGLAVLPAILGSHRPLDLVVIKLGGNDLKARFGVTAFDIAVSVARLANLVRQSKAGPGGGAPDVFVICPAPKPNVAGDLAGMFDGGGAKSLGLAAAFAQMASREALPWLDAGGVAQPSPIDGLHYEGAAQIALGLAMADRLRQHFG